MSNRFFNFATSLYRFVARTKARAEDVNDRLDEVAHGFELVQQELDAQGVVNGLKAPLASPVFTGLPVGPTPLPGGPPAQLATVEHVAGVAMQAALPTLAGAEGKVPRVAGGVVVFDDAFGTPLRVAADTSLQKRKTWHVDTSAPRALLMPAGAVHGDWVVVKDVKLLAAVNNITLDGNGALMPGGDPTYVMDRAGETIVWVFDSVEGWVR